LRGDILLNYEPSQTFYADQGLPNDTEIDLDGTTEYMWEFIALIVGDPISLWDLYSEYVKNPSREFSARVMIDGVVFDDENIVEITLDETVNPDDSLTLGSVASSKLDITVYDIPGTNYTDATVTAEIGLEIEGDIAYVPLGVFTVDSVDKINNRINLTCFDNMVKMEKPYLSTLTYPAPINQIAHEIAQLAGVTLKATLPNTFIDNVLEGYTYRQAIGFIASYMGGFAKFNPDGELEIRTYADTNETVTPDNYMDLQTPDNEFVVGRISCTVPTKDGDVELVAGDGGTGIHFTNPLMTQSRLEEIWDDLKYLTYMPYEMRWQGNPLLFAGDKVTIVDTKDNTYSTIIMQQNLRYTGGLSATTSAKGKSETAQEFDFKGSLTERVERIEQNKADREPDVIPTKPINVEASAGFKTIMLKWSYENPQIVDSYEVYASQISNFVPGENNLVYRGRASGFNYLANTDETWYFKVRAVNIYGTPSDFSDEVSASTVKIDGDVDIAPLTITNQLIAEDAAIDFAKIANVEITNAMIHGRLKANQIEIGPETEFNQGYDPSTKETPQGAQNKADSAEQNAKDYAKNYADGIDDDLREDLRLTAPLPTSITMNNNGIRASAQGTNRYAQLDYRGLFIKGGAIQIERPDGAIWMEDGMVQQDYSVSTYDPHFMTMGLIEGGGNIPADRFEAFFVFSGYYQQHLGHLDGRGTPSIPTEDVRDPDYGYTVRFQRYEFLHTARYLKIAYRIANNSQVSHHRLRLYEAGTPPTGYDSIYYHATYEKGNTGLKNIVIDLGVPSYQVRRVDLRLGWNLSWGSPTEILRFRIERIVQSDYL